MTGFGGHFWINNLYTGINTVYVGDVGGTPIFQDSLTVVTLPPSPNGPITAPTKFFFTSLDGTITAFDQNTKQAIGYLQDPQGNTVTISGLWGLTFGNGKSLGKLNNLYFSASPQDGSTDGLFGKLQSVPENRSPISLLILPSLIFIFGLIKQRHNTL